MKNTSTSNETFQAGTWVVSKMSFGERIHQMLVDGQYDSITRPVQEEDWDKIKVSVWVGSKPVFDGMRIDYPGNHEIFFNN